LGWFEAHPKTRRLSSFNSKKKVLVGESYRTKVRDYFERLSK
jgi:hypothetical protein